MDILETDSRYRKSSLATMRSIIPKLLPFLISCYNYFALWLPLSEPDLFHAIIKSLPILCLGFFLVVHSLSLGSFSPYSKKILVGLMFSAAGDVCLLWTEFFLHGMVMFGLAHLMYITAFGFRPLRLHLFILLALLCATFFLFTLPYLHGPFLYMVPGYSALIGTMAWRALARVSLASYKFSWAHISAALGSLVFVVSDCFLAVDKFCFPIADSRAIVMATYYGGQMFIALSIAGSSEDDFIWKKK
ncbi:lysoplasmalogenase-like protein TMEM86A [Xenopus laevis]|uniref:lysoplasmalogenase n=2 Tax=Xenopus laevis TaxID=8355 RepID=A0A974CI87_XENLA|nr:lysoplasmalogenase-like protein TMEM86A [Xenopus laevis]OCT73155.1 hypothetical protein XELAEV_18036134mg [Xenopus laevis]